MLDRIIDAVAVLSPLAIAIMTLWQQERSRQAHTDELNRQNNAVNGIKADLQKSELDRVADTNRLQGKLDVFAQFAPAIFKLAQATEENTRKQYEAANMAAMRAATTETERAKAWADQLNGMTAVGSENSDPFHSGNSEPSDNSRKG